MSEPAETCFICGNTIAPHGFGYPGPRKDLPEAKRAFRFNACEEHKEQGAKRMEILARPMKT